MKKSNFSNFLFFQIIILLCCFSCKENKPPTPLDLKDEAIIPIPSSMDATGSSFAITKNTSIYVDENSAELKNVGQFLANRLNASTGFATKVIATKDAPKSENIFFTIKKDKDLGAEGYELNITEDGIEVSANESAGIFRGVQTILQILPSNILLGKIQESTWEIASGSIRDKPRYSYRGAMLDVSRHFFSVKDVKRFIDLIALYKMNILHLHLADDQGWRIEIKSWPKLTTIGGSTEVGGGKGGFFTQADYTELVNYAKARFITIVPEIDMPGHTNAALASYPELNCNGKATELYTGTEVGFSSLCIHKDITYRFVDDVIKEVAAITPGPYIHIGGDEAHSTKKKDYIHFINKVQDIVNAHGKQMMGWDDIVAGNLKSNSVAQHWAKSENAIAAAKQNLKIVMSPAKRAYLDMQYDSTTHLGLHWAAYIEVDDGYTWDPETLIEGLKNENVLGIEAPLWTETVTNMDELEYLVFPRLPGYAEIGWASSSSRDWEEYKVRLGKQKEKLEALGIDFYPSKRVPWMDKVRTVTPAKGL